jgi:hypothetical protein
MPVSVAGFVKARRHQFGRQADFGTAVAAKRAYPFKGTPAYGEPWVQPDVDTGSIVDEVAPYRGPNDLTASLTDPALRYNSIPLLLSGFFGGAVAESGAVAKTRLYNPSAVAPLDVVDPFTYEFGDDVTTDWMQMRDGILESFEVTGPEGLGVLTTSMSWRFGELFSSGFTDFPDNPVVPTALSVDPNEAMVYLKDMGLYIASDPYDLAYPNQITDALHTFTMRFTKEVDQKRYANQDQSFAVDAYAVVGIGIELECSFAKTADTVGIGSESDAWYSEQAVDRYVRLYAESAVDADTGVPYSWDQTFPMRYKTRTEGETGGNSLVVLTGGAFFAPTHNVGFYQSEVVNTLDDTNF